MRRQLAVPPSADAPATQGLDESLPPPSSSSNFGLTSPGASAFGATSPGASAFGLTLPGVSAFGPMAPAASAFGLTLPGSSAFGTTSPGTARAPEPAPLLSAFAPLMPAEISESPNAIVATVLHARLHHFGELHQALDAKRAAVFARQVRHLLCDPVTTHEGELADRRPDSILAVFSNGAQEQRPDHAQRALHAAVFAVHEAARLARRLARHPEFQGLPPLSLAVGVHLGHVEVSRQGGQGLQARGEAVELARLLESTAMDLHWSIAASASTRLACGGRAEAGALASVALADDSFLEITEIAGLIPRQGSHTPPEVFARLRETVHANRLPRKRAAAAARSRPALRSGTHLLVEGYRVLRKIGEGGMATVYLAQPADGGPPQVLKVMRGEQGLGGEALQRFIQECALLEQVRHPNVARIHGQDFAAVHAYIAMEYFPQGDLRTHMRAGPVAPATALCYLKQAAAGLGAAHAVGIVHRDMKPDNVMLRQDGSLALADFGVAKRVQPGTAETVDGDIVGTPYYLSPEQALGRPVDARSDIYSLGVMAYELLTGRKPYDAKSTQELLRMHVHEPVPLLPAGLAHLQRVLERMMAKDREQRYPSAQALLDDLARLGA